MDVRRRMKLSALVAVLLGLTGCGGPAWPSDYFPKDVEVERVLFAEGGGGLADTCMAMVAELTGSSATRLIRLDRKVEGKLVLVPPQGWLETPVQPVPSAKTYYESAFSGCNNEGRRPLGDLTGALGRPGTFYKVLDGGQGIGIISPRAKLVGFFYFG
jgi:hypothetical protein